MAYPFAAGIERVVLALVRGEFEGLATGAKSRLTAADLCKAIQQYGRTLVPPPADALASLDVVPVRDTVPREFSVRTPLWTAQEGKSDLTLELAVTEHTGGHDVRIEDIHVL